MDTYSKTHKIKNKTYTKSINSLRQLTHHSLSIQSQLNQAVLVNKDEDALAKKVNNLNSLSLRYGRRPLFIAPIFSNSLFSNPLLAIPLFSAPFKYSKLAFWLSVCLFVQATSLNTYAAVSNATSNDEQSEEEMLNDEQLEEALVALKLKQAVEQGLIDPSVLEDYRRETLDNPRSGTSSQKSTSQDAMSDKTVSNKTEPSNAIESSESDLSSDGIISGNATCNKDDEGIESCDVDDSFEQAFIKAGRGMPDNVTTDDVTSNVAIQSPVEIDALLNEIDSNSSIDTQAPVATLDATNPPIGLDTRLDEFSVPEPNNRATLGLADNEQVITSEGSMGKVQPNEDITNSSTDTNSNTDTSINTNNPLEKTDDITGEKIAKAQDTVTQPSINPDDYLPEYNEIHTEDAKAEAVIDSDTDDTSASNDVGFFKRIYARLFNDGYTSLPKLKANIYLQDESQTDKNGAPLIIKAGNDAQPASNIKATMENITVESISDFTAALPKLRDEALNAAKAVGYYDVSLRFERQSNNTINVIIEELGEPVYVNRRLVDVRGKGSELAEFKKIEEEARPLREDVFNHGAYKNIKSSITGMQEQLGFFDGVWLNKSVDILLPDNTADIDLIFDTGERYRFDEVVFFTLDEETGKLTTDPDKLPVKPELLHKLYNFKAGDDFYQPKITNFTNDLAATQYFNLVNVEVVRPSSGMDSDTPLAFDNNHNSGRTDNINTANDNNTTAQSTNDQSATTQNKNRNITKSSSLSQEIATNNQTDSVSGRNSQVQNQFSNQADSQIKSQVDSQTADQTNTQDYEPIEFEVDEITLDKRDAIKAKAERLISLPDNRVLDEEPEEARSLLGKISDAISNAVKKILPDDEDDLLVSKDKPEDYEAEILRSRKSSKEVAQSKFVPLYVFVMADKPKDADFGVGYGTDAGFRVLARLENNLINRDGYQAGLSIAASQKDKVLNVHASRPLSHPLNDKLHANLSYEQEEKSLGDNRPDISINTIKAGIARNIRKDSGWNRTYSLKYRLDQVDSDVSGAEREDMPYPFNVKSATFNQQSFLLGYAMDKTITDNVTNPSKGFSQYYSIEAGSKDALTDTNMAIVRAGVNGIYSFGELNKHQVLGSFDAGYIWADDFKNVPFKQRFYAGGDRSIRGYDYNSLSALDDNDNLIGGEVLALGSAEYNYEFKPGFRGAVFADVGNAYDANFETDTKLGVGFGIRWASPVGMVRLDLAAGVLEESIPIRLHFFIGSPLK